MKNNRRWLAMLLAVVMVLCNVAFTASATEDESPVRVYQFGAAEAGSPVLVQIMATEANTIADGKLVLTYDADALTYVDTKVGMAWPDDVTLSRNVDEAEGKIILAFASAPASAKGELFTLRFTAKTDAAAVVKLEGVYTTGDQKVESQTALDLSSCDAGDACPSAQFTDVERLFREAHTAVDYMVLNGLMNGMTNTAFGPHVELNRAMMVTILYRMAGSPAVEGAPAFTDVPAGKFYSDAVVWATESGITNGVSAQLFAPDKSLTRQELVTFLYRYAKLQGMDVTAAADLSAYTDADMVQPYAEVPFQWAVANGIIKGTTDTTLDPEATTTRAQICLMVYRMIAALD